MNLSGAINILKPPGMTSFNVVQFIRKKLDIRKVGHAGTLDPSAAGVLPVFIGKATKSIEDFINKDKRYIAEIEFGFDTNTYDFEGEIVNKFEGQINLNNMGSLIAEFKGAIKQIPPMYSAIKIGGKKLYKLARKGIEVERPERDIEIFDISVLNITDNKMLFDVSCSKGTYIRALCHDIGEKSGYYGAMSFLLRVEAGDFKLEDALTLEEIEELVDKNEFNNLIISPEQLYHNTERFILGTNDLEKLMNGMTLVLDNNIQTGKVAIYDENNKLFAIGMILYKNNKYYLKKQKGFV